MIDRLDFYKCKAEKVTIVTIIRVDINYQSHDKRCCLNVNIFATVRKEILQSHKYLLVHLQEAREVLDHRLLAVATAF